MNTRNGNRNGAGDQAADGARGPQTSLSPASREADSQTALKVDASSMAELQQHLDRAVDSSGFLTLMGAFHEYLEVERRRSSRRLLLMAICFAVVLALCLAWPIYLGKAFLDRTETVFKQQNRSFQQFTLTVQSGVASLSAATAELRHALEAQKRAIQSGSGAAPVSPVEPAVAVTPPVTPDVSPSPKELFVAAMPAPSVDVRTNATPAPTRPLAVVAVKPAPEVRAVATNAAPTAAMDDMLKLVSEIESTIATIDHSTNAAAKSAKPASAAGHAGAEGSTPVKKVRN